MATKHRCARKEHKCVVCEGTIERGEYYIEVATLERGLRRYHKYCHQIPRVMKMAFGGPEAI